MGTALLAVSAGLQLFQGFQAYQAGKDQAKAARQNAEYNRQIQEQQADNERRQLKRQQRLFEGQQRVRAAGTGATLGSFDDLFEDSKSESLLDVAILDYNSKLKQQQITFGGQQEAYQAESQGRQALISSIASAAGTGYRAYNAPRTTTFNGSRGRETIYWNKR